jgi:hypothetical protein
MRIQAALVACTIRDLCHMFLQAPVSVRADRGGPRSRRRRDVLLELLVRQRAARRALPKHTVVAPARLAADKGGENGGGHRHERNVARPLVPRAGLLRARDEQRTGRIHAARQTERDARLADLDVRVGRAW